MAKSGKGSAWERELAKFLSFWINGSEKPYVFWRGRGSGAMYTMNDDIGSAFSGDLYCVRPEGQFFTKIFSVEAKNGYPGASIDLHLKQNKNDELKNFWIQAVGDATKAGKLPLLIFKKKGMPNQWVGFSKEAYEKLKKYLEGKIFVHMSWGDELPDIYFYNLKEIFNSECLTPKIIMEVF